MAARVLSHLYPAPTVAGHQWLTMAQLAEHGRFATAEAARHWVKRHPDLPRARRGRVLLVDQRAFDVYVAQAGRR